MSSCTRCRPTGIARRVRFFGSALRQSCGLENAPDGCHIGTREALAEIERDALRPVGGILVSLSQNRLSIGISDTLATVLLGGTRAISRVSSANPALNGASMHTKTARQCSLRGALLVQLSHERALGDSQCSFSVIMHGHIQILYLVALPLSAPTYCSTTCKL
jgi:hypothetical protein